MLVARWPSEDPIAEPTACFPSPEQPREVGAEQWSRAQRRAWPWHRELGTVMPSSGAGACGVGVLAQPSTAQYAPHVHGLMPGCGGLLGPWPRGGSQAASSSSYGQTGSAGGSGQRPVPAGTERSPVRLPGHRARPCVAAQEECQECRTQRGREVARRVRHSGYGTAGTAVAVGGAPTGAGPGRGRRRGCGHGAAIPLGGHPAGTHCTGTGDPSGSGTHSARTWDPSGSAPTPPGHGTPQGPAPTPPGCGTPEGPTQPWERGAGLPSLRSSCAGLHSPGPAPPALACPRAVVLQ